MPYDEDRLPQFATLQLRLSRRRRFTVLTYLCLLHHRNAPTNTAWPSVPSIAQWIGSGSRTVQYATAELVRLGLIRKAFRGRGGQAYEFAQGAPFAFPQLELAAPVEAPPAEIQPPLILAMPDQPAPRKSRTNDAQMTHDPRTSDARMLHGGAPPSELVTTPELLPPVTHDRARDVGTDGVDRAVDRLRLRLGAWPRAEDDARRAVAAALAAGWTIDALVDELRGASSSAAVRDRGAVIHANLQALPNRRPPATAAAPAPAVVELGDAQAGAARARQAIAAARSRRRSKDAGNEPAPPLAAPVRPVERPAGAGRAGQGGPPATSQATPEHDWDAERAAALARFDAAAAAGRELTKIRRGLERAAR